MQNSVIKDVMMASGIGLEAAETALSEKLGDFVKKSWFKDCIYEPIVTNGGTLRIAYVTQEQWAAIFETFDVAEASRQQVEAMLKYIKNTMSLERKKGHFLNKEELEALYEDAYEHRVALADTMIENRKKDAEAKAAKEAAKKNAKAAKGEAMKVASDTATSLEDLARECGVDLMATENTDPVI